MFGTIQTFKEPSELTYVIPLIPRVIRSNTPHLREISLMFGFRLQSRRFFILVCFPLRDCELNHPPSAVPIASASPLTPTSGRPRSVMDAVSFSVEAPRYDACIPQAPNSLLLLDCVTRYTNTFFFLIKKNKNIGKWKVVTGCGGAVLNC